MLFQSHKNTFCQLGSVSDSEKTLSEVPCIGNLKKSQHASGYVTVGVMCNFIILILFPDQTICSVMTFVNVFMEVFH